MNGMEFAYGTRYGVSALDLAILADLGWPMYGTLTEPVPEPVAIVADPPSPPGARSHGRHHVRRPAHPLTTFRSRPGTTPLRAGGRSVPVSLPPFPPGPAGQRRPSRPCRRGAVDTPAALT